MYRIEGALPRRIRTSLFHFISALLIALVAWVAPAAAAVDHASSCALATVIEPGTSAAGYHDHPGDDDTFAIPVRTSGLLRLRLVGDDGHEPRMHLLGRDCLGGRAGVRSITATDVERLLLVDGPGTYFVRVRGRAEAQGRPYSLGTGFAALTSTPDLELESLADAAEECTGGSRNGAAAGLDFQDPVDEDEPPVVVVQSQAAPSTSGFWDFQDPVDEDEPPVVVVQSRASELPAGSAFPGMPVFDRDRYVELRGDIDAEDSDVISVRLARPGVLSVASRGVELAASLYAGSRCDSSTQVASDVDLATAGLLGRLEPGLYYLRLTPQLAAAGAYRLDLRFAAIPEA